MSAASFDAQIRAAFLAELARHHVELKRHARVMAEIAARSEAREVFGALDLTDYADPPGTRH